MDDEDNWHSVEIKVRAYPNLPRYLFWKALNSSDAIIGVTF